MVRSLPNKMIKQAFRKPALFWILGIFVIYIIINLFISGFYQTLPLIIKYASTLNWIELGISLLLSLSIGFLVALNTVVAFLRYRERKKCLEGSVAASIGTLGGLATGFCPLCLTGLFPLLFGLFGVTFSFASLPLKGVEIQLLALVILLTSLWMLERK